MQGVSISNLTFTSFEKEGNSKLALLSRFSNEIFLFALTDSYSVVKVKK